MINILTEDDLIKVGKLDGKVVVYGDNELILANGLPECKVHMDMIGFVMCLKGHVCAIENERTIVINENDMFIYRPNSFFELKCDNPNVEMIGMFASKEYVKNLVLAPGNIWDIFCFFDHFSVIPTDNHVAMRLCQYYDFIKSNILEQPASYGREIISALVQAFLYQLASTISTSVRFSAPEFTSSERLFKEFTGIITSLYPKPRSVSFYADKLNVTPKYLSAVCKEESGKTASDIITSFVIKDVKFLLTRTEKGIKEITHELEFSSISFFGKYVKKNLGMSPKHYRDKFYKKV